MWALTTSTRIWAALPFWDLRPVSLLSSTSLFSLAFELGSHGSSRKASRGGQAGERCCRRRGSCGTQGVNHFHSGTTAPAAAGSPQRCRQRVHAANQQEKEWSGESIRKKHILSQTGAFTSTLVHSFKGQLPHKESV